MVLAKGTERRRHGGLNPRPPLKGNSAKRLELADCGFSLFRLFLMVYKGCLVLTLAPQMQ